MPSLTPMAVKRIDFMPAALAAQSRLCEKRSERKMTLRADCLRTHMTPSATRSCSSSRCMLQLEITPGRNLSEKDR